MSFTGTIRSGRAQVRRRYRLCGLLLLGLMATLGACKPTPVVDEPANNLDIKINVLDTEANPSDGKVPVIVQFFFNGQYSQLAGSASVSCNGVPLPLNGLGYAERVPKQNTGGNYSFVYTRNGVNTTVNVTVPARPVITAPTQGANVTRSNSLTINYVADGGSGIRGSAGDGSTGLGHDVQTDNGTYTGFDVSSLHAGPGSIGVTREFTLTPGGTGFHSVEVKYSSGKDIQVTWN